MASLVYRAEPLGGNLLGAIIYHFCVIFIKPIEILCIMRNYLFVFQKPNQVTNVPFYELRTLLKDVANIGITEVPVFDENLYFTRDRIKRRLPGKSPSPGKEFESYPTPNRGRANLYALEQSCIVTTSSPIEDDDLARIVGNSGYIHSAGELLLAGRFDSIKRSMLEDALKRVDTPQKPTSVEFWTDGNVPDEDLSGLAIDNQRYFIENLPFATQQVLLAERHEKKSPNKMVTFYKDVLHGPDSRYPESGDSIFILAFCPQIRKYSPLQQLDEWKPYWKGIDTTPQCLMAAMLNIAGLRKGGVYLDMFGGMGTSMLEATKVGPKLALHTDYMETTGADDNHNLLTMDPTEIINLVKKLRVLQQRDSSLFTGLKELAEQSLDWEGVGTERSYPEIRHIDAFMGDNPSLSDLSNRLCFYMLRRGYYRRADLTGGLIELFNENLGEIERYAEAKLKANQKALQWTSNGILYVASFPSREGWKTAKADILEGNLASIITPGEVDAIVTDPPYGYGTDSDRDVLLKLYESFIGQSFDLLRNRGRLVFCVLDKVRTGKPADPYLTTEGILYMMDRLASDRGIGFFRDSLHSSGDVMFWKSRKKLNRGIISVEVVK